MHIMIDLETMGTGPDAAIVAIGAVGFDNMGILREFYAHVDLGSAIKSGASVDASTIMWWLKQSDEAREALIEAEAHSLVGALSALNNWVPWAGVSGVWGNGATFDNVILRQSYNRTAVRCPWPFWQDKCYRTVKNAYPHIMMDRSGTHHNALDDAKSQAKHLIALDEAASGVYL